MSDLAAHIRDIPDFPKPGILFKDITPLLLDADEVAALVDACRDSGLLVLSAGEKVLRANLERFKGEFLAQNVFLTEEAAFNDAKAFDPASGRVFQPSIIKESERLTRLINQVLDLSKLESGRAEWEIEDVDGVAKSSPLYAKYGTRLDNQSARELLAEGDEAVVELERVHVAHQERRRLGEAWVIEQRAHLAMAGAVGEREGRAGHHDRRRRDGQLPPTP